MHFHTELFHLAAPRALAALAGIYSTAAVFSGLSGFGFSAIGCLSLLVLPPQLGIALLMALSLATQASSFGSLWPELRQHALPWSRRDGVVPYLAGGTLGMPAGLAVLSLLGARELTVALGLLLVAYAGWSLLKPAALRLGDTRPSRWRSFLVGAVGGVVGGFSAFPGSALVVWNGLVGVSKEQGRALTQPFILWMQVVGLVLVTVMRPRLFDAAFWLVFAAALPAALLGNALGVAIYRRTGDVGYRRITFAALGLTGAGLVLKVLLA
jgi:uncharacterized membrane protein YfcA